MKNIIKAIKIKKELKRFKNFKINYNFQQGTLKEENGAYFFENVCIKENENSDFIGEGDNYVNVGYKLKGALPKILSNLFPYTFYFRGYTLHSIESFFQSLKFKNVKAQKQIFLLSGLDSNNIKGAKEFDWSQEQTLYFLGKPYKRNSKEYETLVDELYVSLLQNPLYVNALKNVGDKYILHAIGEEDHTKTVFSRYEFEKQLNCLKEYCIKYK